MKQDRGDKKYKREKIIGDYFERYLIVASPQPRDIMPMGAPFGLAFFLKRGFPSRNA